MGFLVRVLVNAMAILIAAAVVPGIELSGAGAALGAGLVLGLINGLIRPILFGGGPRSGCRAGWQGRTRVFLAAG